MNPRFDQMTDKEKRQNQAEQNHFMNTLRERRLRIAAAEKEIENGETEQNSVGNKIKRFNK